MYQFSPSINKIFQTNFSGKKRSEFSKLKNSWNRCGFPLFGCWPLWFPEKKFSILKVEKNHGKTSSGLDFLPKTSRRRHWPTLRKVWRALRHLRFLCEAVYLSSDLRRMQLWKLPRKMRDLRRTWSQWCLLLQRMYNSRKRSRWMPKGISIF